MRRRTLLLAIAATLSLVLLASACGRASLREGFGGAPGPTGGNTSSPGDGCVSIPPIPGASRNSDSPVGSPCDTTPGGPPEPIEPTPRLVTPSPGMENVNPIGWDGYEVVSPDGRVLRVTFSSGIEPCAVLDHVTVRETDARVTITLYEGSDPAHPDTACIEIAELKAVDATLDAPVGNREVVDTTN